MNKKTSPSITCPKCHKTSYSLGDIQHEFCIDCGFHSDILRNLKHEKHSGGKANVLELIASDHGMVEPIMFNFAQWDDERIRQQLAVHWFHHVSTELSLTPLENAKKYYRGGLNLLPVNDGCHVDELLQFCYPEDPPQKALFAVAQKGGLVALYSHDIVWFKEPDGSEFWARMD